MLEKVISPLCTVTDNPSEVFATRFSNDGTLLAAGCADGFVRVYSAANASLMYTLEDMTGQNLPITALRFRPTGTRSSAKNVLLVACSDGKVYHWQVTSGRILNVIDESKFNKVNGNQVLALDYRKDGNWFATAGKDRFIRVYDENTKKEVCKMKQGARGLTPGHSNRVFSMKFDPDDNNCIISGGWDNTVQIWDIRTKRAERSIFGPHVCGDSVDICKGVILTGSWRPQNALQLWDLGTGELIEDIPWHSSQIHTSSATLLYCAQFSSGDGRYIAAGGSGSNECKVFDRQRRNEVVGRISGMSKAVFAVDFDPFCSKLAVAGGDTAIRVLRVTEGQKAKDPVVESKASRLKKRKSSEGLLHLDEEMYRSEQKVKNVDDFKNIEAFG